MRQNLTIVNANICVINIHLTNYIDKTFVSSYVEYRI
nr:MAG TPA: hypothetical protein [Caudoviricetes sp.]